MTQPNLLDLAKQGDPRAITGLLNRSLQPKGITAKVSDRSGALHVLLEAASAPNQASAIRFIEQGLSKLGLPSQTVTVYARQEGNSDVAWQESFALAGVDPLVGQPAVGQPAVGQPAVGQPAVGQPVQDDLSFDSSNDNFSVDAPSEPEDALSFSDDEPAPNFGFDLNAPIDSSTDYSPTDYSPLDYSATNYGPVDASDEFGFEPGSPFAVAAAYGALDDVEEDGPTSSPFAAYDPTYEGISIEEPASSPFAAPSIYDTLNTAPDTIAFAPPDHPETGFSMPDISAATPNLQMPTSTSGEPTIVEPPSMGTSIGTSMGLGAMGAGVVAGAAAMAGNAASTASKTVGGAASAASQFTFGDLDLDHRPRPGAAAPPPPPKAMPEVGFVDSSHGEPTLIVDNSDEEMGLDDDDPDSDILMSLWGEMDDDSIEDDLIDASAEAERAPGLRSGMGEGSSGLLDDRPVTVVGEPRLSKGGNLKWLIVFPIAALLGLGSAAVSGKLGPVLAGVPVLGQFFGGQEPGLIEASNTLKSVPEEPVEASSPTPSLPKPTHSAGHSGITKPVEKPVEKPADKPVEKPADKPVEKPADKPADKPMESAKPAPGAVSFYNGVKLATQAATLAQTAKGPQEWTTVAGKWQEAAQLMEEVPASFDRATIAKQKVAEYQKNATIAQTRAK
jgi:hypothetical protein